MAIIASFLRPDTLYQMKVDENAAGNLLISFMSLLCLPVTNHAISGTELI